MLYQLHTHQLENKTKDCRQSKIISPLWVGFEPTREDPIWFLVKRLNHSAITALKAVTTSTFIKRRVEETSPYMNHAYDVEYKVSCRPPRASINAFACSAPLAERMLQAHGSTQIAQIFRLLLKISVGGATKMSIRHFFSGPASAGPTYTYILKYMDVNNVVHMYSACHTS